VRTVAFDLDGTLLRGTTVSLQLAAQTGHLDEQTELERRYAAGEISNAVIAEAQAGWLGGAVPVLDLDGWPWIAGIEETIAALRPSRVVIATVTWSMAAAAVAARFAFDAWCGTDHGPPVRVCDASAKAAWALAQAGGGELIAVGDSRSDLELFAAADLSIALNADASARAAASVCVDAEDLRAILPLLG
jgi:phosphoserine phosphatase